MIVRRKFAALLCPLALLAGGEAEAQVSRALKAKPGLDVPAGIGPEADAPIRSYRVQDAAAPGDGLLHSWDVGDGAKLGVGRFSVPEIGRPRTNVEQEDEPAAIRPREQGIAAIGLKLRF